MDPAIGEAGDIDTSLAMLTFANGVVVTVDNCRKATYGYDQRVEVFGSKVNKYMSKITDTWSHDCPGSISAQKKTEKRHAGSLFIG